VSFYYETVTTNDIFTKLVGFDSDVTTNVDANSQTPYSLYQTRGKSVLECLQELGDTFNTAGGYIGWQHIVAANRAQIRVGFRPSSASFTFAHGFDSTTDDELRIKSVNLKLTTNQRPASVIVIGTAANGSPIIVQRDDRALASSFRTQSRMALTTTLTDESINTLFDADRKAWQILDSVSRGTWEGTVTVAGVYPNLFDLNAANPTYGAGGHIHLKYSPLGITDALYPDGFHVKGIVLRENTTEIQVSNTDLLLFNALTDARGRAERSESFLAPDDPFTTAFVSGYYANVRNYTLYAQLCTADNTPIPSHSRVLCTKTSNARYNDYTYHAEFDTDNGHTVDGTPVERIELYDDPLAGTERANYVLPVSERFPKWRTTRVIAEVHCKAS
jgi:hypothetical protein